MKNLFNRDLTEEARITIIGLGRSTTKKTVTVFLIGADTYDFSIVKGGVKKVTRFQVEGKRNFNKVKGYIKAEFNNFNDDVVVRDRGVEYQAALPKITVRTAKSVTLEAAQAASIKTPKSFGKGATVEIQIRYDGSTNQTMIHVSNGNDRFDIASKSIKPIIAALLTLQQYFAVECVTSNHMVNLTSDEIISLNDAIEQALFPQATVTEETFNKTMATFAGKSASVWVETVTISELDNMDFEGEVVVEDVNEQDAEAIAVVEAAYNEYAEWSSKPETTVDEVESTILDAAIALQDVSKEEEWLAIATENNSTEEQEEARETLRVLRAEAAIALARYKETNARFNGDGFMLEGAINGLKDWYRFAAYEFVDPVIREAA